MITHLRGLGFHGMIDASALQKPKLKLCGPAEPIHAMGSSTNENDALVFQISLEHFVLAATLDVRA